MHVFFIEQPKPFGNLYKFCQVHLEDDELTDNDCLDEIEKYNKWFKLDSLTPEDLNIKFQQCADYLQSKGHTIVLVEEKDEERFK